MFFSVREPAAPEIPVLVEIPHAGLRIEPATASTLVAPVRALARDADLYVDELFRDASAEGATVLSADTTRYICDLNRGEDDVDGRAVAGAPARKAPHGLIWLTTTDDQPALAAPLDPSELERRLDRLYRPYHRKLAEILAGKRRRFGFAILLCAHSMPSLGRRHGSAARRQRADVVPGSRGRTTASTEVVEAPETLARAHGWTTAHDDPFQGGYSTARYGQPETGIHAVQIELSRRLYMSEEDLTKKVNEFDEVRDFCRTLVASLGRLALG